jgi:glucose-fructose oxidoreductase
MKYRYHHTPQPRLGRRDVIVGAMSSGALWAAGGAAGCATAPASSQNANAPTPGTTPDSDSTKPVLSKPLGVALLGLGNYSETQLAPALRLTKNCTLRGIVTGSPDKVEPWREKYDIAEANVYDYESLPSISSNAAIHVVYVVVPTSLHAKYCIMAAEAGKHVWCEKPMAMTVEECQSIIDACKANGVSLAIGYRMQHEPNTQTLIRWATEKPYGAITSIRAVAGGHSDDNSGWRMDPKMGGGALYDMGVYAINAIRYASGEEPVRVLRARQWADRPDVFTAVDENTEFELELPSGVVAYGKASRFDNENRVRVEAANGWYELEPMQSYTGVKGKTSDGKALDQPIENQQARQMDNEALALLEGRAPLVPGEEGLRDVRIVQAIIKSAQTGQAVNI